MADASLPSVVDETTFSGDEAPAETPADVAQESQRERDIAGLLQMHAAQLNEFKSENAHLVSSHEGLLAEVQRLQHENDQFRSGRAAGDSADPGGASRLHAEVSELRQRLLHVEDERGVLVKQKEILAGELDQATKDRSESDLKLFQLGEELR